MTRVAMARRPAPPSRVMSRHLRATGANAGRQRSTMAIRSGL